MWRRESSTYMHDRTTASQLRDELAAIGCSCLAAKQNSRRGEWQVNSRWGEPQADSACFERCLLCQGKLRAMQTGKTPSLHPMSTHPFAFIEFQVFPLFLFFQCCAVFQSSLHPACRLCFDKECPPEEGAPRECPSEANPPGFSQGEPSHNVPARPL